jgi:hypothetical protein
VISIQRIILYLVILLGLTTTLSPVGTKAPSLFFQDATATSNDLIIGALLRANYPNQQSLVDMYKKYLDSSDYIFGASGDLKNANLLPGSKVGTWNSLADIQTNAPTLKSKGITILGYDLEKALSPSSDLSNPVGSMKSAADIAHKYGLLFAAVPGYPFVTPSYASQFASYANIFVIQAQGWETTHSGSQSCQQKIGDISNAIRSANVNTIVIAQLSTTTGTISDMEKCTFFISNMISGVEANYGLTSDQVTLLDQFFASFVADPPSSKHATGLTMNQIAGSKPWGQSLTVTGKLVDIYSSDKGVAGQSITFSTSGGASLPAVTTMLDGTFSSTGKAATSVGDTWTVQAHYAGNSLYTTADSEIRGYSTTAHSTSVTLNISPKKVAPSASYQVSGVLDDALTGTPIGGRTILFTATSPIKIPSTVTGTTGTYSLSGLKAPAVAGMYNIQAHFPAASCCLYKPNDSTPSTLTVTLTATARPSSTTTTIPNFRNATEPTSSYLSSYSPITNSGDRTLNKTTKASLAASSLSVLKQQLSPSLGLSSQTQQQSRYYDTPRNTVSPQHVYGYSYPNPFLYQPPTTSSLQGGLLMMPFLHSSKPFSSQQNQLGQLYTLNENVFTNHPPVANAGVSQTVNEKEKVTLNGKLSYAAYGHVIIGYQWTQLPIGVPVTLTGSNTAMPTFTAPAIAADTVLEFSLRVIDSHGSVSTNPSTVYVMVKQIPSYGTTSADPIDGLGTGMLQNNFHFR